MGQLNVSLGIEPGKSDETFYVTYFAFGRSVLRKVTWKFS